MKTIRKEQARRSIENTKIRLKKKAETSGLCENFGQKEVRKIQEKYNYDSLVYGSPEQREIASLIADFDEWCMNYEG